MPHNVALFVGRRLGIYVVSAAAFALLVVAVVIVGFAALVNGSTEPPIQTTIGRYADALKAIGAGVRLPINQGPGQPHDALPRLATVKENIQTAELIARDVEQQLATKASGCIFAKTAGDAIEKEILPAAAATKNSLDALLSGTKDRLSNLTKENTAFGWAGWRGSREQEIQELLLFAHDIATTTANADLAFTRLKIKATALNKVALTCQ
jgi:hypothetical protein